MFNPNQIRSLEKVLDRTKDFIFIVEGKRDKRILSDLGIKTVFSISGRPLEDVAEMVEAKLSRRKNASVVILTDFDRDGKRKSDGLERLLRSSCIQIKKDTRNFFKRSLHITKIEELKGAVAMLENKENFNKILNRKAYEDKRIEKLNIQN